MATQYVDLTPDQRELYNRIDIDAGYNGRDTRDLLLEASASPEDKAAVAEVFGGPGAGEEFLR
jgi:hypothetical protein